MTELSEREKAVLEMWERGMTGGQIGLKMGVTRGAILGVVCRLRAKGVRIERRDPVPPPPPLPKADRPKKAPKGPPPLPPRPERELTIYDLGPTTCRWPTSGNSKDGTLRYCGAEAIGHVYCEAHRKVAARPKMAFDDV